MVGAFSQFRVVGCLAMGLVFVASIGCGDAFSSCESSGTCVAPDEDAGASDAPAPGSGASAAGGSGGAAGGSGGAAQGAAPGSGGALAADAGDAGWDLPRGGRDGGDAIRDVFASDTGHDATLTCEPFFADCNGAASDGCEADLTVDPQHCGECGAACLDVGTTQSGCVDGVCREPICSEEYGDCNGVFADGCEVELLDDPDHCGDCATACADLNVAMRGCVQGECAPECAPDFGDCDGDPTNGCETDLRQDPDHCGSCDLSCSGDHVDTRACEAGVCSPKCDAAWGDCDTPANDGCETSLVTAQDCGICGRDCQGAACASGAAVVRCEPLAIASGRPVPRGIAVDDYRVLWIERRDSSGVVFQRAHGVGSLPEPADFTSGMLVDVVAGANYIYWSDAQVGAPFLRRRLLAPPFGSGILDRIGLPEHLFLFGEYVYYTTGTSPRTEDLSTNNRIARTRVDGIGTTEPLISESVGVLTDIVVDAADVYYAAGGIYRLPLSKREPERLAPSYSTKQLAIDAGHVYFGSNGVHRIAKATGVRTQVAPSVGNVGPLAVDGPTVYFLTDTGLFQVPKSGGSAELIADEVDAPYELAVHDGVLYWTNYGSEDQDTGSVMKLVP